MTEEHIHTENCDLEGHSHGEGGHGHSHGHGEGHGHSHGGHGHSHGEGGHGHSHGESGHGHSHGEEGHGHSHGHGEECDHGPTNVFLEGQVDGGEDWVTENQLLKAQNEMVGRKYDDEVPTQWTDITDMINSACEDLCTSQLIQVDDFELFWAMNAVEIMDKKMDPGFDYQNISTLNELVQNNTLNKSSSLDILQVLAIMDKLFILESMWIDGCDLSQSLWTCLYLHEPFEMLDDIFLKCFVFILLKRVDIIREVIVSRHIFSSSDFSGAKHGLSLDIPDDLVQNIFDEALRELERHNDQLNGKNTDVTPFSDDDSEEKTIINALNDRIQLSKELLEIQLLFDREELKGLNASKRKLAAISKTFLPAIESNYYTPHLIPEGLFQDDISKRVFPLTNPKQVHSLSFNDSVQILRKSIDHLSILTQIATYNTFGRLKTLITDLVEDKADIMVRSRFMDLTFQSDDKIFGQYPLIDFTLKYYTEQFHIPEYILLATPVKNYFDQYLTNFVMKSFSLLAANEALHHKKLSSFILELNFLVHKANKAEKGFQKNRDFPDQPHYLYFMMTDELLSAAVTYLKLGFKLDLYENDELSWIYWYLENIMFYRKRHYHILREFKNKFKDEETELNMIAEENEVKEIETIKSEPKPTGGKRGKRGGRGGKRGRGGAQKKAPAPQPKVVSKKGNKKKNKKKAEKDHGPSPLYFHIETELYLIRGITRTLAVLESMGKPEVEYPFGSNDKRFFLRFKPFYQSQGLPIFDYSRFEESWTQDFLRRGTKKLTGEANESYQACVTYSTAYPTAYPPPSPAEITIVRRLADLSKDNELILSEINENVNLTVEFQTSNGHISFAINN